MSLRLDTTPIDDDANSSKLTVLIPCKDEAHRIEDCIRSAMDIADEVLVADSGSTDETLDIVRRVGGCRIINREFVNYADFKNWAMGHAANPWVMILDADERLTPELGAEMREAIKSDNHDGYWIRARYFFLGHEIRHGGWQTQKNMRLFRRDRCQYGVSRVHEFVEIDESKTAELSNPLIHYSIDSLDDYFSKYAKYTRLGAMDMWDKGKRASFFNMLVSPFLRFGWLYIVRRGFLDGAAGLQICMLQAFFVTFAKRARLWEMENLRGVAAGQEEAIVDRRKAA